MSYEAYDHKNKDTFTSLSMFVFKPFESLGPRILRHIHVEQTLTC